MENPKQKTTKAEAVVASAACRGGQRKGRPVDRHLHPQVSNYLWEMLFLAELGSSCLQQVTAAALHSHLLI